MNLETTDKTDTTNQANTPDPEEHFDTLGELLTQLKSHLLTSAGKKGTYGDYLKLLDFYRDVHPRDQTELVVRWVDPGEEEFSETPCE